MLLDSSSAVIEGLSFQLNNESGKCVVGSARKPSLGIKMAKVIRPDILLVEPNMPGGGGMHLINALLIEDTTLKIILVTTDIEVLNVINYFKRGVYGYVSKFCSYDELLFAIDSVTHHKKYIEQDMLIKMDEVNYFVEEPIKNLSCSYDIQMQK